MSLKEDKRFCTYEIRGECQKEGGMHAYTPCVCFNSGQSCVDFEARVIDEERGV